MGREVRRVPAGWQHPKDAEGSYIPLLDGACYEATVRDWDEGAVKWAEGLRDDYHGGRGPVEGEYAHLTYAEWAGKRPEADDYMPRWPESECTHLMMYENVTEGTPISPAFETPEELARWLTDNDADAYAGRTASYEGWLRVAQDGYAPSMVIVDGVVMSGVDGLK